MGCHRRFLLGGCLLGLMGLLSAGCLGQDYLDQPLDLSEVDHGWLGTIEAGEELSVGLRANPAFPDAAWQIVEFDAAVISLDDSFSEVAEPAAPDDQQSLLTVWVFVFTGGDLGESPLTFEVRSDGRQVDVAEFTIAVVEDACASDVGVSAARCRQDISDDRASRDWSEWDHGLTMALEAGEQTSVALSANALYPDVPWQLAGYDPTVVEAESLGTWSVRTAGDWDVSGSEKPGSFLRVSEFIVTGVGAGESPLVFELRVGDERVEVVEFSAVVEADS